MSNLIVIRIVPPSPIDPGPFVPQSPANPPTFTDYLSYLGGLQITAYDLSFNNLPNGQSVGMAAYVTPIIGLDRQLQMHQSCLPEYILNMF